MAAPLAAPTAATPGELRLTAISQRDGRPVAMINDRLVFEGDGAGQGAQAIRQALAEVTHGDVHGQAQQDRQPQQTEHKLQLCGTGGVGADGDHDLARTEFAELLKAHPDNLTLQLGQAENEQYANNVDKSLELFKAI